VITRDRLFIGGTWVAPSTASTITVTNPATEQPIGVVPAAGTADVDAAVKAARRVVDDPDGWSTWTVQERGEALLRLAALIEKHASELAAHVSDQNGMPISFANATEGVSPAGLLQYYAYVASTQALFEDRTGPTGLVTRVRRVPVGVVAAVVPWNYPLTLTFFKLAPALAAGCAVVIKPAPETVLDAFLIADLIDEAGLPAGLVSIVPADREISAYLVAHPGVDKVAFTGSTAAGRAIGEACGWLLRPVTLELGGKSAAVVLEDADLDSDALFGAMLLNNGQTCYLSTRILAPRSRYGDVIDAIAAMAERVQLGDPRDPSTTMGPLVSRGQQQRVLSLIARAAEGGGRLVAGGAAPPADTGFYVRPTVFADVDNSSELAKTEAFGPVLAVIPYDGGDDDAVRLANDSRYGLGGTVWSRDPERAERVASRIRTGTVGINGYTLDVTAPFGGVKDSGLGRELGPEGLAAYQVLTSTYGVTPR
jgi:aldehyde dehydrogenase (NAD+)